MKVKISKNGGWTYQPDKGEVQRFSLLALFGSFLEDYNNYVVVEF